MPQLEFFPWLYIFIFTWCVFLFLGPLKILKVKLASQPPINLFLTDPKKNWSWMWQ